MMLPVGDAAPSPSMRDSTRSQTRHHPPSLGRGAAERDRRPRAMVEDYEALNARPSFILADVLHRQQPGTTYPGHTHAEVDEMLGRDDYDPVTGEPPREWYMRGVDLGRSQVATASWVGDSIDAHDLRSIRDPNDILAIVANPVSTVPVVLDREQVGALRDLAEQQMTADDLWGPTEGPALPAGFDGTLFGRPFIIMERTPSATRRYLGLP